MGGEDHAASPDPAEPDGQPENGLLKRAKDLYALTPWGARRKMENLRAGLTTVEDRLDGIESALRAIQDDLAETRDNRLEPVEKRADTLESALRDVSQEIGRLRDEVFPASVARSDALLQRLAEELEEVASLAERSLRKEPLPLSGVAPMDQGRLADALAKVQPLLLESFRGGEDEIRHRLDPYLPDLKTAPPVLDLGSGRGELLLMLREAGIESTGVEGDKALAEAARRRGLKIIEGEVLEVLREQDPESFGSVAAIHLFEHLAPPHLAAVLAEIRRVLQPNGLLIAECPNPHTLRVGAALFWQDPTHHRPLLPETLELILRAAGFKLESRELLHPFPPDQLLLDDEGGTGAVTDPEISMLAERVDRLRNRLDEILNGPRDFVVRARK